MNRLKDKVCIVTGAALGIGQACALRLAQEDAHIAVFDILDIEGEGLATELKAQGFDAAYWHVDVANEAEVARAIADVAARSGAVHVLVNNAGIAGVNKPTHELTEAEWDHVQAVNVKGVFFCTKHVMPQMRRAGYGSIINLSSVRGIRGYGGGNSAYCGTKGAVEMITKTLAIELAPFNIRVNALGPALIITQGTIHIQQNPQLAEKYKALIPMGRLGLPEDLVGPAVYLASDAAAFHTGQTLFIDGGATAS